MSSISRRRAFSLVRWGILLAVLGYVTWEFYAHAKLDKVHPSVHALCPLGGLESLLRWITADGATLAKVFSGTMGLFFVSVGLALLLRRSFCGNICPLGTLQDLSGALGRRLLGPGRFRVPARLDRVLRHAKYPVLALAVGMAWLTGTLWIQAFDPWPAYAHLVSPAELLPAYAIGLGVLVVSLILSFLYERAFCKYLCPMGALTALTGLLSPWKVRRSVPACVDCGACDRECPVGIRVSAADAVGDPECLSCGKCVAACPAPGALGMGWTRRLSPPPAAGVALGAGLFLLGVLGLQLLGFDRVSGRQEPTLRELAKGAGMDAAAFRAAYGLPPGLPAGTRASALQEAIPLARFAELNGRTAASLKEELGLPASLADETPWGEAYGAAPLGRIAELNGMDFEAFKARFGLAEEVGPETPWGEVRAAVEKAAERIAREEAAAAGGMAEGESCGGE